jgi:hypothetical protein
MGTLLLGVNDTEESAESAPRRKYAGWRTKLNADPIPGTPRNRLRRAAGVAPGEGVGGYTK